MNKTKTHPSQSSSSWRTSAQNTLASNASGLTYFKIAALRHWPICMITCTGHPDLAKSVALPARKALKPKVAAPGTLIKDNKFLKRFKNWEDVKLKSCRPLVMDWSLGRSLCDRHNLSIEPGLQMHFLAIYDPSGMCFRLRSCRWHVKSLSIQIEEWRPLGSWPCSEMSPLSKSTASDCTLNRNCHATRNKSPSVWNSLRLSHSWINWDISWVVSKGTSLKIRCSANCSTFFKPCRAKLTSSVRQSRERPWNLQAQAMYPT